jgi:adenosylcobyric acid synthase
MNAKNIMFQGTASTVGKSIIATAFCRIFKQDGYKVAPFKSQNMALNSYITLDGKEMGRAQVVQAEAAGIEPRVEMNPILIKPSSDCSAQIILKGKVFKNMSAVSYDEYKYFFMDIVMESYNKLSSDNDIVVIEGAGSPAEINLRKRDIVNMEIANKVNSPVILIGDIDKGGVFASIYGTMMLLNETDRKRIKGIIINKFRGDVEILKPGLKMLEDLVNVPVLGVIPYFNLSIDDEDSVTERFNKSSLNNKEINIGVIKLPYMSNFTDFAPLENQKNVNLFYFNKKIDFMPDLVIIPGTKSTISDLKFIRNEGIEDWLKYYYKSGGIIMGICGGYQMLGQKISDSDKVESNLTEVNGLGLLDITTEFIHDKITSRVKAKVLNLENTAIKDLSNTYIEGYEIHMGISRPAGNVRPFIQIKSRLKEKSEEIDGYMSSDGKIFGTYIHGIFDTPEFLMKILNVLKINKGLRKISTEIIDYKSFKDSQYDKLALIVRNNMNINKIYEIIFK